MEYKKLAKIVDRLSGRKKEHKINCALNARGVADEFDVLGCTCKKIKSYIDDKRITLRIQENQSHQTIMLPTALAKQIVKIAKYMHVTPDEWTIGRLWGQLSRFKHKVK